MKGRRKRAAIGLGIGGLIAVVVAMSLGVAGAGAKQQSTLALPRAQTLYMSGTQWSPYNDLNPAKNWDYASGIVGLAYETAFRYDPLTDKFIPWLATGGTWASKTTYVMSVRQGVKWSDGQSMTAKDVAYSFNILNIPTHPQHALWQTTGLKSVRTVGKTVVFTFSGAPGVQQFDFYRFNVAIVPQHVFKSYSKTEIATGNMADPKKIVGTGPYAYQSGDRRPRRRSCGRRGRLVGDEGARPQRRAAVRRRHPQHVECGCTFQPPGGKHRSLQQLRTEVCDQGAVQDLLR